MGGYTVLGEDIEQWEGTVLGEDIEQWEGTCIRTFAD